jgi:hypothetical protein
MFHQVSDTYVPAKCVTVQYSPLSPLWRNIIRCWPLHGYFVSLHGYLLQLSSARLADDQKRSCTSRIFQGLFR